MNKPVAAAAAADIPSAAAATDAVATAAVATDATDATDATAAAPAGRGRAALLLSRRWQLRVSLVLLAALALALAAWYGQQQREQTEREAKLESELFARVLEGHVGRTLGSTANTLRALAANPLTADADQGGELARLLQQQLAGQSHLRSLALLDADGRVLASTTATDRGLRIDRARLGAADGGSLNARLGSVQRLRELGELALAAPPSAVVAALPMLRELETAGGRRWLVALINVGYFTTQHAVITSGRPVRALLVGLDGTLIDAADDMPAKDRHGQVDPDGTLIDGSGAALTATGRDLKMLAPFTRFLPRLESAAYIDTGSDGQPVIAAFRTSRLWPLLVIAEQPLADVEADWHGRAGAAWAAALAIVGLLALLGGMAEFGLRREIRARLRLDTLHAEVASAEQRWQLALEGAGHGVWDMDLASGRASLSATLMGLLGQPAEPAVWTLADWRDHVHPDDVSPALAAAQAHLRGQAPSVEFQLRMRHASGEWRWVLAGGMRAGGRRSLSQRPGDQPWLSQRPGDQRSGDQRGDQCSAAEPSGDPSSAAQAPSARLPLPGRTTGAARFVGTLTDIHARKTAELALRASEERQQAILRSALDGIITVDSDGCVIDCNPAAEVIFGHDLAAMSGRPMYEVIVPQRHHQTIQDSLERFKAQVHGPLLNRRVKIEAMRADGTEFSIELAIVPVTTDTGMVFTVTARDISERLQTEAALRSSRAMLDKVGRIAQVGGWTMEMKPGVAPYWTDQTALIHDRPAGYQVADMAEALSYYAPGAAEQIGQAVQQAIASGEGFDLELPLITATGRHIWVRALGRPELVNNQPIRMVGAFQDVTTRVQAEQELRQARSRELMIGARIQQSLLVDTPDQRLPGLWLSTLSQASQGVDGDFIEMVSLGERGIDIIVGDVMGKGVAAALMGAATKMQFSRCFAELVARPGMGNALPAPAEVMMAVHEAMTPRLQDLEVFVTLSYLRLDMQAGLLTWVGCGHEEPLLLCADGRRQTLQNQHPPLGVLSELSFEQDTWPLARGDALFLCSDGGGDALMPDGSRFGRERMIELLAGLLRELHTPAAVLHALRREIEASGASLTDDLTLALAMLPGDILQASRRELVHGLDDLGHVRGLVEDRALKAGLDEVDASLFTLACVEAYTNAVRHTRGRPEQAPIELVVGLDDAALSVEIVTLGEPYELPSAVAEPELEGFPEGGFGLQIMREAADEVTHACRLGVNSVRLVRRRR